MGLNVARKAELGVSIDFSRPTPQETGHPRGRLQFFNLFLTGGFALLMGGNLLAAVVDHPAKANTVTTSQAVRYDSSYKSLPECPPIRGAKSDPKNHTPCSSK